MFIFTDLVEGGGFIFKDGELGNELVIYWGRNILKDNIWVDMG